MFKTEIARLLDLDEDKLEIPPDPKLGDYAFPCFTVSKNPVEYAKEFAGKEPEGIIQKIEAKGPYINIFIKPEERAKRVLKTKEYGKKQGKKILIEYPSPNTNKPLHLGHVRNMALGKSISNILKKAGNEVIQVNLNNDRGIHICKSMLAYQKFGNNEKPSKKPDHFVGDYYVKFAEEAEKTPELEEEAQEMLRKWEEGDEEVRALWEKMNSWALKGFAETYERYGIKFDKVYNEHEVYKDGKDIVLNNMDKLQEDEETGAIIAPLEKYDLPDKVVLRSDGTSIYATQDIALTKKKEDDFSPDRQIWVVGNEQDMYFRQLFAILDLLNITEKEKLYHLSYGMIALPSGRMKSREGKVVDADDLLDEMIRLAKKEIKRDVDKDEIAEKIALSAIRFFILSYDPRKDFTFDPESSLSFEGDTGPYVQYTHARICSILSKAGKFEGKVEELTDKEEQALLRELERFPEDFDKAAEEMKPSAICTRLINIAQSFNSFYHKCPVLDSDKKDARLELLKHTKYVLAEGLKLLGIEPVEEM